MAQPKDLYLSQRLQDCHWPESRLLEGGISEQETIFLEVEGTGSREVRLGVYPTLRGWIEHPVSLGLGKRIGGGLGCELQSKGRRIR